MRCLFAIAALSLLAVGLPASASTLTIYRCTDASGKVMLRDSPCPRGQQQDARQMRRPQDPPAQTTRPAAPRPTSAVASPPPPTQVIVVTPPQALYECRRPNGSRYTSESGEGNPRWVPLWTLGWPVLAERERVQPAQGSIHVRDGRVSGSLHSGGVVRETVITPAGYGAGQWVRDSCERLPQAEACARLRDERAEVRRRHFNGQPTERDRLRLRERAINAQLDNDCGGR